MSLTDEELREVVMAELSGEALARCVAYVALTPVPAGSTLSFPGLTFEVEGEALLAFVDLDPMANWSHPARYVLVDRASGQVTAIDARLPPFRGLGDADEHQWRVLYRAPSVPDPMLAAPQL